MDDPLSAFPPATAQTPEFFANYADRVRKRDLRSRLEEIVGPLSEDQFESLAPIAENNFEAAVTNFLDQAQEEEELFVSEDGPFTEPANGTEPEHKLPEARTTTATDPGPAVNAAAEPVSASAETNTGSIADVKEETDPTEAVSPWQDGQRYIGSLQASAWCTRPGTSVVKYGERLRIDRPGRQAFFKTKDDYNVRFYNAQGLGFARASEEEARFMAVLLDANVCTFEATVIYADARVRIGSTVIVMVDCYLKQSAFSKISSFGMDLNKKKTIIDETKETKEERLVRQRQQALVELFRRLELVSDTPVQQHQQQQQEPVIDGTQDDEGGELNSDQLNMFYDNAESARSKLEGETAEPGPTFKLRLFPYQKRGLSWMLAREREMGTVDEAKSETHPLWTEFKWPQGDQFWANLNSGELSLSRPTLALKSRGGILADDMGLGKTISALALVHSGVNESKEHSTLIVAPMSLLSQWESEIQKATVSADKCGCFIYYGSNTNPSRNLLREFLLSRRHERKVVVTTYGTVKFEHDKRGHLFSTNFDRIILDEAQNIKNRTTLAARACFDLRGQRRWVLTGTPVVNRLEDLYSLVRFIGVEPWDNFRFWKSFITEKFQKPETRETAMKTVQAIVAPICLRRTKAMKDPDTGQALVLLPKKTVEIKRIPFTNEERTLYSHLFARVRASVQAKVLDGTATTKYVAILKLLTRLRQVCCHPLLLLSNEDDSGDGTNDGESLLSQPPSKRRRTDDDLKIDLTADMNLLIDKFSSASASMPSIEYTAETLKGLLDHPLEKEECPICSDLQEEPVLTECLHSACRDCMFTHLDYLKRRGDATVCHICRSPVDAARLFTVNKNARRLQPLNQKMQSSKVRALIAALTKNQHAGKAVVFSYFTSFMDLIEMNLHEAGFPVFRFDGGMSKNQRSSAIDGFLTSPHKNAVLILSQLAGGTGLNLVAAKHAYLMDPWWNYATESQAMDRIHRMGQRDEVQITRFIIEGSIEERMLKIQEHKHALSDLVTSSEERKSENLENLKLLLDLDDSSAI